MWATSVPILVFLGLSVLELGPMNVTDRQIDVRQHHHLMPTHRGWGIKISNVIKMKHSHGNMPQMNHSYTCGKISNSNSRIGYAVHLPHKVSTFHHIVKNIH